VAAWPTVTFFTPQKDLYLNEQAVQVMHQPAAHTDGDSLVFFRRSDVVCAGDIFDKTRYPVIDRAKGGSITGIIDALNQLLDLTVSGQYEEGGTMVIPGHGRIADEADVVDYRDMVTVIRDRIQDLVKKGRTLAQVQAAKPTMEYDPIYGATTGSWTTEMFVEAIYRDLATAATK
jgi:glyoxylase-like metal-dependent hydrolase (beta-lactamase superfamily II)